MRRRTTTYIVLHCSATSSMADIGASEIRHWHKAKGWSDIGYHFVVRRDGEVEEGRSLDEVGSHVRNYNASSVGVCLVGGVDARQRPKNNFTAAQWSALKALLTDLQRQFPSSRVIGHRDFPGVNKACPCFDAVDWAKANGFRAAARLQPVTASMLRAIRHEIEDGDEADDAAPVSSTGPGKWLAAILGSGGAGSLAGFGYGMDWLSLLVLMLGLVVATCSVLVAIGAERREQLWDRLFR
ncbi:MAG: N-acetylmuramoyl-L-alanine amidase [Pseudomonadota bacterium]